MYTFWSVHLAKEIKIIGHDSSKLFFVGNVVEQWIINNPQILNKSRIAGKYFITLLKQLKRENTFEMKTKWIIKISFRRKT